MKSYYFFLLMGYCLTLPRGGREGVDLVAELGGNDDLSRCKRMRGRGADEEHTNSRQERLPSAKEGETA